VSDTVFLTGGTGFIGSHVLRELVAAGYRVRALVRNRAAALPGCDAVLGDLEHTGRLAQHIAGCRYVVHCGARYSFAPADRAGMGRVNVGGTAGLLLAARVAGVERCVVTSSASTVGASDDGLAVDERRMPPPEDAPSTYHGSKREQERAARAARVPAVLLLPTAPIGPGDGAPTPTGQMVLDFARGRMMSLPPHGGMNLVPVEDVARAHVRALTAGRPGERYLLGGENLTLDALWALLAGVTGRPMPRARIPIWALTMLAHTDDARCRVLRGSRPVVPLEGVRLAQHRMYVDSRKAAAALDFHPGSVRSALERAVSWYRARGDTA
jgi:dihydroflavonol-4-reductase